jgi:hypothetical protein
MLRSVISMRWRSLMDPWKGGTNYIYYPNDGEQMRGSTVIQSVQARIAHLLLHQVTDCSVLHTNLFQGQINTQEYITYFRNPDRYLFKFR